MQLPAPQQVPVVENSLIIHCPPDCAVLNTIPSYSPPIDPSSCFFSAIRFVRRLRSTFRITTTMTTIRRINTQAVITSAFFSSAVRSITSPMIGRLVSYSRSLCSPSWKLNRQIVFSPRTAKTSASVILLSWPCSKPGSRQQYHR